MENKPIVTCHGEQELFSSIHHELAQGLPREAVEWRRSYGRAPKMIHVDVNFVPYNPDLLPTENDRKLLQLPVLHTYWTECPDADAYKVCVKNDISAWQQALKERNVSDWLIILVETSNPKRGNKQKFLPRTSVLDKIRNDFCSKQSDRVIVLHEPNNPVPTQRAMDSWVLFLQRLRYLVLQAYNRVLGRFEELIRAERESRNDRAWNFCRYFLLQEELAFMFETLRQFEDALVQYDELDALFSQFIINSSAGATTKWLSDFQAPCNCWDGLNLSKPVNMDKRELLERGKPTLLDVRNYLFSRQCALLLLLKRPWEVAHRAQHFMHNCVQELGILEVTMPQGSIACWVFLSCLEVLQKCEKSSDAAHINTYSHYTASLWLYAQKKLDELGQFAGLMPDTCPTSEQLHSVVDLLAGMGQTAELGARENSPNQMLREALSSQESFSKHYLELSELAMGTFKHIGRMRSAKLIGQDLARFYMKTGELHKAETFLTDALKVYEKEGWPLLVAACRKELAECYKRLDNQEKYLKLCCKLAADQHAGPERQTFFEEMKRLSAEIEPDEEKDNGQALLSLDFICSPPTLSITPPDGHVGKEEVASIKVTFTSRLPAPITVEQITLQLHDQLSLAIGGPEGQPIRLEKSPSQDSLGRLRALEAAAAARVKGRVRVLPDFKTEVKELEEKPDSEKLVESSSVVCTNADAVLQRQDSSTSLGRSRDVVTKDTCSQSLVLEGVEIRPGVNELAYEFKSSANGSYQPHQLVLGVGQAEFVGGLEGSQEIEVFSKEAQLTVSPNADLLSGIPQSVSLHLASGHTPIESGTTLAITTPSTLAILPSETDEYRVESRADGGEVSFLRGVKSHGEAELRVGVAAAMWRHMEGEKEDKQNMQFSVECPWSETVMTTLEFSSPFTFQHRIYTAGQRKFLQVTVKSRCNSTFNLTSQSLEVRGVSLLKLTSPVPITSCPLQPGRTVSYIWEATPLPDPPPTQSGVGLVFSVDYEQIPSPKPQEGADQTEEDQKQRTGTYEFDILNFQTLFEISSIIKPRIKEEVCRAGTLCTLDMSIKMLDMPHSQAPPPSEAPPTSEAPPSDSKPGGQSLMYEINTDGGMWAVCGRSTGVITMPTQGSEVTEFTLEVIPLIAGFLPMPAVKLSQYVTAVEQGEGIISSVEGRGEGIANKHPSHHHGNLSDQKPTILPYADSQVFYRSKASQIRVLPECNLSTVEVALS